MNLFDDRWMGRHGIGRFAEEVYARLPEYTRGQFPGKPFDPVDPVRIAAILYRRQPGFFYSPGYNPPIAAPCPFAFTVHDLNHISVRENGSALKRSYYNCILRPAIRRAAIVLTVSEFSRAEICTWAKVAADRVVNVGNGVSAAFCVEGGRYDTGGWPYFVCIGSSRAHKNFGRIIRAFEASGLARSARLVIVGSVTEDLQRAVRDARMDPVVLFTGSVDDAELARIYRGALALVFPSTYEGFGLPVLEAMACGTPVITSKAAALPEVAGDAALLVDPIDVDALAEAMRRISSDAGLGANLSMLGLKRVGQYSWEATAQAVRQALSPWQPGSG